MTKNRNRTITASLAACLAVASLFSCSSEKTASEAGARDYAFATIGRGTIESIVSSSGTLSVVSSIGVLAQMSGRLETVNVDYNDTVKKGQVLATINTDILRLQARSAQATVDKARANYELELLAVRNAEKLSEKGLLSEYELKTAQSTLTVRLAELSSAVSSYEQIETEMNQYAVITSPIDGIVLERAIDAGQSVVGGSSSSSTSLFTIVEDLAKMQIEAQVDELDIGSIKAGQAVRFTAEADPGVTHTGTVKEVRLMPEASENVVYYRVIILADNESGTLLPGMTASVSFIKQKKSDILVVPSAALRFTPTTLSEGEIERAVFLAGLAGLSADEKARAEADYDERLKKRAEAVEQRSGEQKVGGLSSLMSGAPGGRMGGMGGGRGFDGPPGSEGAAAGSQASKAAAAVEKKPLWYLDDTGRLAAVLVEVGLSDGTRTEVSGADGLEGMSIIQKIKVE